MNDKASQFNFLATGIGSVPFQDIGDTCRNILSYFPSMPFWPQFVKRSYLEDMSAQYCEGLPLLEVNEQERSIRVSQKLNAESQLTEFYEYFLANNIDHFSISRNCAPGFYTLLELIRENENDNGCCIKGQTVGPVTFGAGIADRDGKPVLHNEALMEALVSGLAIKAVWQARKLADTGRTPVIFLDEPYLSGFGSAFSSVQRDDVIRMLRTVISYLQENSDARVGIHCCGNTDWSMIVEAGPDIISFDAFAYMDHFLLYPKEIGQFLEAGGNVAWGIVPTSAFTGKESVEMLFLRLEAGLSRMKEWGMDPGMLAERSILTPACGMGTMRHEDAEKCMELLCSLSVKCRERLVA
ncbi:MAG: hypothetical protein B5M55_07185 [Desulfococcus sp. 4484_242]|nr:MAG: hypothetical protein B5M55_07185 [Desulfococcus sp. 4484_242]